MFSAALCFVWILAPKGQLQGWVESRLVLERNNWKDQVSQAPTAAACRRMAVAYRGARFWELLGGVLKHAAACRGEPKLSHGGLFFHNMSNLWTLCCTDVSELDGSSVVNVLDPSLRG